MEVRRFGRGRPADDCRRLVEYFVFPDKPQRTWVSIGIFTDKAEADESTVKVIAFGRQGTHDWMSARTARS